MEREHTYPSVRITISKLNKKDRKVHFAKEGTEVTMMSGTDTTYLSTSQVSSLCMLICWKTLLVVTNIWASLY